MAEEILDIAVGVLVDPQHRVLIARRRADTPGAERWEFPGGKQEADESIADCLARELAEEIGVTHPVGRTLIRFVHRRGPRPVRLHVVRIDRWTGEPAGREGQEIAWREPRELDALDMLPATGVILSALALPPVYTITPAIGRGRAAREAWFESLERALRTRAADATKPFIRLRQPQLDDDDYAALARRVLDNARPYGARVLLDRAASLVERLGAHGLHASGRRAQRLDRRPLDGSYWFGLSAHNGDDLAHAHAIDADFATLSPVAVTETHPEMRPMGWPRFEDVRSDHAVPVYALGGLGLDDLATARDHYAQGVAGIRGFWPGT